MTDHTYNAPSCNALFLCIGNSARSVENVFRQSMRINIFGNFPQPMLEKNPILRELKNMGETKV